MSPEITGPDDPKRWMDFAQTDLRMAREGEKNGYRLEPLCFHAQQAAEKALKALFVSRRLPFPKTHDLEKLMAQLPPDLTPSADVRAASVLSGYSEAGRYPHGFEDVTTKDYRWAVELAQAVVQWAGKNLIKEQPPGVQESRVVYRAKPIAGRKKRKGINHGR